MCCKDSLYLANTTLAAALGAAAAASGGLLARRLRLATALLARLCRCRRLGWAWPHRPPLPRKGRRRTVCPWSAGRLLSISVWCVSEGEQTKLLQEAADGG
ncbi:unnamed protein product [Ectocarpus sp. 12 AP-2014]